jgi:NAD(P)-dependent dehydrogenase (short-subunit alcohol dehydrogenase family)
MASQTESAELPSFRLDDRLAIVTGASHGIDRAFALAYGRAGAEVALVSRGSKLLEAQGAAESAGGRAHASCADVGKLEDIQRLEWSVLKLIERRNLGLVLVNSAGFYKTCIR